MSKRLARLDIIADRPILIDANCCDLCGACIGVCPPDCMTMDLNSLKVVGKDCIKCGFCIPVCPLEALSWNGEGGNGHSEEIEIIVN